MWLGSAPEAIQSTRQLWHGRRAHPFTYRLGADSDAAAAADELWDYVAGLAGGQAAAGARAVDPGSAWYRGLDKPSWQPPPRVFGLIWTPLYVSIAWAGGRALQRACGRQRNALAASLAVNLALNVAWNWLFFGRHRPT